MKPIIPFISQQTEQQQTTWIEKLRSALPEESFEPAKQINETNQKQCEIAVVANPAPTDLSLFPNLKWVQSLWAGVEHLIQPSINQNFKIVRMIDPFLTETMTEAVLAWSLYLHRKMPTYTLQQEEKLWLPHIYIPSNQCNIGILGLGELGQASAKRLVHNGFSVMGWSRSRKNINNVKTFSGQDGLVEMLKTTNILVCLLPLTKETQGVINHNLLAHLPKGASLINFARGGLIVTDDLMNLLDKNELYHAVLDVFEREPLDSTSTLWSNQKITILPHIAATTNIETATKIVAQNILNYRQTGKIDSDVDLKKGY